MSKYYETKNKNEFGVPMVIETFDDDMQYGFYWKGDNEKWKTSDCGTKSAVMGRLQRLIVRCTQIMIAHQIYGYKKSSEAKEIKIYKELMCALEDM